MQKMVIEGGYPLSGNISVSGAKNSVVALIPAALLANGVSVIENVPDIRDVYVMKDIAEELGAVVDYKKNENMLIINAAPARKTKVSEEKAGRARASYYFLGALLGRFGKATVPMPGGCNFGGRPIDLHIKGFETLGATVTEDEDVVVATTKDTLFGQEIYLDFPSVGATINIMLAACRAEGRTFIRNAACEPHIVDVANFLNAMGARITGAATGTIRIDGVDEMHGAVHSVIPDQIEAGTYMIAAAAVGKDVTVCNVIPRHMEFLTDKLIQMGVKVEEGGDSIRVSACENPKAINFTTTPYPGFPTDLQPQMVTFLTVAKGESKVREGVWNNRFQYVDELKLLGAEIVAEGQNATVHGVPFLTGAQVRATDLRAGAAMIIAGLMAKGKTVITELEHIDRGYEGIEEKLRAIGAHIQRIEE